MNKRDDSTIRPEIRVNPRDLDEIVCEACGNQTFQPVMILKRLPALVSPDGEERTLSFPTYACNACGNVNAQFIKHIPIKGKAQPSAPESSLEPPKGLVSPNQEEAQPPQGPPKLTIIS